MRTLGIGLMYWASRWSDNQLPFLQKAQQAGFEAVEISLVTGGDFDVAAYRQALGQFGLKPYCIMALNAQTDITSPDSAIRRAGIEYVKRALEAVHQLGSPILCGLPYMQWLYFPPDGNFQAYRDRGAAALREVAITASDLDVTICLEIINRYETFMFNTVADSLRFLDQVDHPSVKVHLDTYHMNMEEDNLAAAIRQAGSQLGHFHCVANNRKLPDRGTIDWGEIRRALDDIQYDGGLAIEAFPLPETETGRSVNTWRPLVDDLDADVRAAAAFLRQTLID
jgi:D-psicose/D-tagatose/L-ribulose 3-epimerase